MINYLRRIYFTMFKRCHLAPNCIIRKYVNIYDSHVMAHSIINPFVEVQKSFIGSNTRIQSHSFICAESVIGNNVFVGHGVIFCNHKHPEVNSQNWNCEPIIVENNVSIGSGAIILPGVRLQQGCKIAAGAVVTKSVPAEETWVGVPAKKKDSKEKVMGFK